MDETRDSGRERTPWTENAGGIAFAAAWLASLSSIGLIAVMPRVGFFGLGDQYEASATLAVNGLAAAAGGVTGGLLTRNAAPRRAWIGFVYGVAGVVYYAGFGAAAAWLIPAVGRALR